MATLLLAAAGSALGGAMGIGAMVGQAIGGIAGAVIDRALLHSGASVTGPRLADLDVQSSSEGADVPRVYGRVRLAGQVIWATRYEETVVEETHGGKGGVSSTSYRYHANFAVGLCEGPISRVARVWADGTLLDTETVTMRVHLGSEDQEADPLILARQGGEVPAYRGTAIVVFERFPLDDWGNRIPQLTFEVIRVVDALESEIRAVTLIPGATEFGYDTRAVTRASFGATASENRHTASAATDFLAALDELVELCPNLERIALVVSWFGDDLRVGECRLRPAVDAADKDTSPTLWSVAGLSRTEARVVARLDGRAAYGGTPSDASVVAAIREIRSRGLKVTLYPFVSMDLAPGNGLPDPYGGAEQAAFPWRGRITCHPAPGRPGTSDRTAAVRADVAAFVGDVPRSAFAVSGDTVLCADPTEWSFRRMILHMAHLAVAAGGVDAFLLGSEFVGLTTLRDGAGAYPFVEALVALAADARAVLGPATAITYGADWTEWFGHHPADGSGDVRFHLDPLWASPNVDAVGIDAWFPLTDWRPGDHLDAALHDGSADRAALAAGIAGGENFDWYYASDADRRAQIRTPIVDTAHGEHWVFRPKDLAGWWSNPHHDRPGGVRAPTPTAWVPGSKPIWFTELGCPAVDLGANRPSAFPDPKSSEGGLPPFSSGARDDLVQRRFLETVLDHWNPDRHPAHNPLSPVTGRPMVDLAHAHLWTWDARPYPVFPSAVDVWSDGPAWSTGHWLTGRLGGTSIEGLIRAVLADFDFDEVAFRAVPGHVDGFVIDRRMAAREALEPLLAAFCVDAVDTGTALRFCGRGRRVDAELAHADLVETEKAPLIEIRRRQESELPAEVSVTFSDAALDHRRTTVSSRRLAGGAKRASSADLSMVAPVETVAGLVDVWLADLWASRTSLRFALDPTRLALEPGDVIDLHVENRLERLLIEAITDGAARTVEARSLDPAAYRPSRSAARLRRGALSPLRPTPVVHVLDLAHPTDDGELHRPWIAAWASPWTGRLAVRRRLDAATLASAGTIDRPALIGETVTALRRGPVAVWDRATVLDVRLLGGTLAAASERMVLDGANRAAVRASNGRWEVFQFAGAELVAAATWRLTDLLREQGGSDDAWDGVSEIAAGAPFVLLDDRLVALPTGRDDVGREIVWRVGPAADPPTAPSWVEVAATPEGRGLRSWSPAHLGARVDPVSGDVAFSWVRRSRAAGADSWAFAEVPFPETAEAWRLEIRRAGTLVRTVDTAAPAWVWPGAARAAAFGANPVDVEVSVAQVDPVWGVGVPRRAVFRL